ncbi:ankyrin repeat and zinc finger domain-containing protein 1-like isoform X2 [Dreissena polymorpha]|uniref:VLRF1 domain-containing protein n=2 Tax=Dreissena polymorpha TaxID=45954 RepID=A0A9D4CA16_DREPO|nr:ankyrin repeat and zinc finger domain-containing protein 1-like isoform X2 [Dreissena polymorpha]XP_052246981.1 ankyrin repeat and zinc finger domain-containing protein 1-like isoform X2 [Dreissena polymorpha]KAH3719844.1 hypothetical protein DPMN_062728 [Dreissena polymorpha]
MASNEQKKLQRVKPKTYFFCQLYNTEHARKKLEGLVLAGRNPATKVVTGEMEDSRDTQGEDPSTVTSLEPGQLSVSDVMSCNYCNTVFYNRIEQKRHYRSDWHRYNLKQRLLGRDGVSEQKFDDISGNISSLSGSDSENDESSDSESKNKTLPGKPLHGSPRRRFQAANNSSTDSESEAWSQSDDIARRLPKVFFKNKEGELLSLYRCVLCNKKNYPANSDDLVSMATELPGQMTWAVFMAGGGHFAGAIFKKNEMVLHKTFHRYVVRAKRGTAQSSRDSQGNAPKSAGASLRRYNEAALTQEIQDLISSWGDQLQQCNRIFLRAPSFNRKIFFSGKNPPLDKADKRVRLVPFMTRRPTHNEVRRVFELLASIECYGIESELLDGVPISPPNTFNPVTGALEPTDEDQLSLRQRKIINKKLGTSPLVTPTEEASGDTDVSRITSEHKKGEVMSSDSSSASDTELVETMATINFMELKEYAFTKKPKRKKRRGQLRTQPVKGQNEPESNIMEEEKFHLRNGLFTACKTGDKDSLKRILAVIFTSRTEGCKNPVTENEIENNESGVTAKKDNADTEDLTFPTVLANKKEVLCKESDNLCKDKSDKIEENGHFTSERDCLSKDQGDMTESLNSGENEFGWDVNNASYITDNIKSDDNNENIPDLVDTENGLKTRNDNMHNSEHSLEDMGMSLNVQKPSQQLVLTSQEVATNKPSKAVNESHKSEPTGYDLSSVFVGPDLLNEPIGDQRTTLLQVAAREGHLTVVGMLLDAGADPALRDSKGHTAYMDSKDKATRNEFRRYRASHPNRYDYTAAQIPEPLSEEKEAERKKKDQERKKAQKKAKQEQQKLKKEEEEKQRAEEREKQRFLNLSDREKRALSAEKRLVSQYTNQRADKPVLSRCFLCGADMTGKVPFEYNQNKFCTSKCLQAHRKSTLKST